MTAPVLILTRPDDFHGFAVAEALRRKGVHAILWQTTDYPTRSRETVEVANDRCALGVDQLPGDPFDQRPGAIWLRRPGIAFDDDMLHPADREFARGECLGFRRAVYAMLADGPLCVNPPDRGQRANHKPLQLREAVRCGLAVPDTIFSNDPARIRNFIRSQGGSCVYKAMGQSPGVWTDGTNSWVLYSNTVTESDLPDDPLITTTPGIYQQHLRKASELRITVIGKHIFPARILSQHSEDGKLDFRRAYDQIAMEPAGLPHSLRESLLELVGRLGLVFGCIDMVETPEGQHVFLEINEMGQFLFVEEMAGLPLLDAFAELLRQGRADFDWHEDRVSVRLDEVEETVSSQIEAAATAHAAIPLQAHRDD